ncbi:hypothetical protein [uncultured Chryseobacterium sp.]|uniref:hypothetical protein n=1 Tax=uncultured Chryseobacterium sp. TaxID=259322 RepID=UPI00262341AF|nr:hypothetical protein [uncultured Chryseobacterium sp.]
MNAKNLILSFLVIATALLACRSDDEGLQKIDQILQLYVRNTSGQDLLNPKISGSYQSLTLTDIGGLYDQSSISGYALKKDADTVTYLEYKAGATRYLLDSTNPDYKRYRSDMQANYITSSNDTIQDTISVVYEWTPQVFQIQSVLYNKATVFTKTEGASNIVKIVK